MFGSPSSKIASDFWSNPDLGSKFTLLLFWIIGQSEILKKNDEIIETIGFYVDHLGNRIRLFNETWIWAQKPSLEISSDF